MCGCDQRGQKEEKEAAAGSHLAPGGREQGQHRLAWGRARTGPGGTLEGKQLLSNLHGARDNSKEHPTALLFSLKCPVLPRSPLPERSGPAAHEGHGPQPRMLCISPSTGPVEPEGPTSGDTHSSTPPALTQPAPKNAGTGVSPVRAAAAGSPSTSQRSEPSPMGPSHNPHSPPELCRLPSGWFDSGAGACPSRNHRKSSVRGCGMERGSRTASPSSLKGEDEGPPSQGCLVGRGFPTAFSSISVKGEDGGSPFPRLGATVVPRGWGVPLHNAGSVRVLTARLVRAWGS